MTTISFSLARNHGHYWGSPGHQVVIKDGVITSAAPNEDLVEIRRLLGLSDSVDREKMIELETEASADLLRLNDVLQYVINNSPATLVEIEGKQHPVFAQFNLQLASEKVQTFLRKGLNFEADQIDLEELDAEFRCRHSYATPMEFFPTNNYTYTTWSGTVIEVDMYSGWYISISVPLNRVLKANGQEGYHFSLLK
jgi:hypothetical protein